MRYVQLLSSLPFFQGEAIRCLFIEGTGSLILQMLRKRGCELLSKKKHAKGIQLLERVRLPREMEGEGGGCSSDVC